MDKLTECVAKVLLDEAWTGRRKAAQSALMAGLGLESFPERTLDAYGSALSQPARRRS